MKTILLIIFLGFLGCSVPNHKSKIQPFEPNWESLSKIEEEPEWFKDAKLGIYFHWGVYSVPAYETEWYPRWMYIGDSTYKRGGKIFAHHQKTYGKDFNYHDFIPMFTASSFNAADWAELFEMTGARFAGPVAQHHDGFAMWDSDVNPWNVADMGPKRDITGELFQSLKKRNIKTIATFHHAKLGQLYANDTSNWMGAGYRAGYDSHYPYHPTLVTSTTDPKLRLLYGTLKKKNSINTGWSRLTR